MKTYKLIWLTFVATAKYLLLSGCTATSLIFLFERGYFNFNGVVVYTGFMLILCADLVFKFIKEAKEIIEND